MPLNNDTKTNQIGTVPKTVENHTNQSSTNYVITNEDRTNQDNKTVQFKAISEP